MDPRLLKYYDSELVHLREMGAEFAREMPKIAGRLGLESLECADPYVERLLESFAFLAARIQLRLDASFENFTQHLLDLVYPHYLRPTPSMLVAHLQPNLYEPALAKGVVVPRHTQLRSRVPGSEATPCTYRTGHDTVLWPLEMKSAQWGGYRGELGSNPPPGVGRPRGALRFQLDTTAGIRFCDTELDELTIHLRGTTSTSLAVYERLMSDVVALTVRPLDAPEGAPGVEDWVEVVHRSPVEAVGFSDEESLLPGVRRSFSGYRLVEEYFAFPQRFMFVKLRGLAAAVKRHAGQSLEVSVLFERREEALDGAVERSLFELFCTPAINVFPKLADPIHLDDKRHDHHVIADRSRPMDFEVFAIEEVAALGRSASDRRVVDPLYALTAGGFRSHGGDASAFYTLRREPRKTSSRQQEQGPRSSYLGSEAFLNLTDARGPHRGDLSQLSIKVLATNRDLPMLMPLLPSASRGSDFSMESGAPVDAVRCIAGPTAPVPSRAHGDTAWKLISHLSLNYLSITGGEEGAGVRALREMLSLYADLAHDSTRRQIEGLVGVESSPITRRLPVRGHPVFGRGTEIRVRFDETAFEGSGTFLLASALQRFFARYATINSFTETVLETVQRGEVKRWPATIGTRRDL